MSIPDFQSAMLPILKILNEKRESSTSTIRDGVALFLKQLNKKDVNYYLLEKLEFLTIE